MKLKQEQIEKLRYELSITVQPEKILIDLLDTIKSKDKRIRELERQNELLKKSYHDAMYHLGLSQQAIQEQVTLEKERKYFEQNLSKWLSEHKGMIVLVKGEEVIGFYNTFDEALADGARLYGFDSFLVRRIEEESEQEIHIPALSLGILRAAESY
jgi:hypothetical protein